MPPKSQVEQLAAFVQRAAFAELTDQALERLKLHVLDTLGCATRSPTWRWTWTTRG